MTVAAGLVDSLQLGGESRPWFADRKETALFPNLLELAELRIEELRREAELYRIARNGSRRRTTVRAIQDRKEWR